MPRSLMATLTCRHEENVLPSTAQPAQDERDASPPPSKSGREKIRPVETAAYSNARPATIRRRTGNTAGRQ